MRIAAHRVALSATLAALALSGCGATATDEGDHNAALSVAAAFYPLEYVAERVGGEHVAVTTLTPPGVEPHDVELSPATVRAMGNADLVLYIRDFQPAIEDAIDATGSTGFDATTVIELTQTGHAPGEDDHAHGASDPHFWLDPQLLAAYAVALGEQYAAIDPAHADTYTANAADLAVELSDLDKQFATGLASCERRDVITAHEAFGYLARAFDLQQVGIAGIEPDTEPSPARLREIGRLIRATGATTVFTEQLVSPRVAQAVADDAGVTTAVLDPIETVADGDDYPSVMVRNLDALRQALDCE